MPSSAKQYIDGLVRRGFSPAQAAALAGNIQSESAGNPTAYNADENAYGLMQWRLDRKTGLEDYARSTGRDPRDPEAQLDWLAVEMTGPEAKSARGFLAAQDPASASAALKGYIRYANGTENERLNNTLSFAQGYGRQETPGMQALAQPDTSAGDKLLDQFLGPNPTAPASPGKSNDDDLLDLFLGPAPITSGAEIPTATPVVPAAPEMSAPTTPGAFGNNPMAPDLSAIPAPAESGATPEPYRDTYLGQGMSGVNEGIGNILGLPVDLTTLGVNTATGGVNALLGTNIPRITNPALGSGQINALMSGAGAIQPETDDPNKKFVRRVAQEVGASSVPILGMAGKAVRPLRMAANELLTSTGSGIGAAVAQSRLPDNPYAEMIGQVVGGLGANALAKGVSHAITPFDISAPRQEAINALTKEGVDLTAGQQTGSKKLQYIESELGGGRIEDLNQKQAEQFTAAALNRAGISADRATPEVMSEGLKVIGKEFDDLAARNSLTADQQTVQDLGAVWSDYTGNVNPSARAPIVKNTIKDIADALAANNGQITGDAYKTITSRIERAARGTSDPELASALRGIKGSLDDTMERTLAAAGSPDLGAWRQARSDYRSFLVLEKAAQGGGEKAALGIISPAQLRMAAQSIYGKRSYVTGKDQFSELAQAGQATMTPLPQSGTASRTAARNMLTNAPAFAGSILGGSAGGIPGAIAGWAAGKIAPDVAANLLLSGTGRKYLTNALIKRGGPVDAAGRAAVPAAIANNPLLGQ